jgi:predicted enzyme related to lactoylglutathione lyase
MLALEPESRLSTARELAVIKGLTYAIVTTDDVPRARRFFTQQLGLQTEDDMGDEFSQFTTREGTLWAIMQRPEGSPALGAELYLQVEDVDAAYTAWRARGVETISEPHNEPFGRTFAFKDPDGRVLHAWAPGT